MRRLVWISTLAVWSSVAMAQSAPAEPVGPAPMADMLDAVLDDERPLGSPVLMSGYIMVAVLGVWLAVRKPAAAED